MELIMRILIAVVLLLVPATANADVFEIRELYLINKNFFEGSRSFYISESDIENRDLDREVSLFWNIDLIDGMFYFDNQLISYTDRNSESGETDQFRFMGWHFKFGARITSFLDVGYAHFSGHLLDAEYPRMKFPVEDSWYVRIDFYEKHDRGGMFW
jgi:hypothetical protein